MRMISRRSETDSERAGKRAGAAYYELLRIKGKDKREEAKHTCGMCVNYIASPFNEGYGICVIENSEGRISAIEFTEEPTKCFTGKFERRDDDDD